MNKNNGRSASGVSEESYQETAGFGAEKGNKNNYTTEVCGTDGPPGGPGPAPRERAAAEGLTGLAAAGAAREDPPWRDDSGTLFCGSHACSRGAFLHFSDTARCFFACGPWFLA